MVDRVRLWETGEEDVTAGGVVGTDLSAFVSLLVTLFRSLPRLDEGGPAAPTEEDDVGAEEEAEAD